MADEEKRPEFETMHVLVPGDGGTEEKRFGADLNGIVRGILWDLKREREWPDWKEAARHLGLPQQTLSRLMSGSGGIKLETLSKVCAALQIEAPAFLQLHEHYSAEKRYAADAIFDQFRAVLSRGEASRLLAVVGFLKRAGALDSALTTLETISPRRATSRETKRGVTSSR